MTDRMSAPGAPHAPDATDTPGTSDTPGTCATRATASAPAAPVRDGIAPDEARRESAARFASVVDLIDSGQLEFPLPGSGRTAARLAALRSVAEEDLCVARLVEGHVDALAILAELDGPAPMPGQRWGVWAAEPPNATLEATPSGDGWVLSGLKPYCSGARSCTHALVTARTTEGRRLFAVAVDAARCVPVEGTWQALGMAGSDTPDVHFDRVPAVAVGDVESYVQRPGFQHGGIGVAACWLGGAIAVAHALRRAAAQRSDPHTDAHLGAVDVQLHAARAVLDQAAAEIDADPADSSGQADVRGLRVRAFIESVCSEVLTRVGRATGAGPLCHDLRHARDVADLTVYVRQHHGERDLAHLGAVLARPQESR
ncbi:acyl-CoA dehydrogenase [Streptomyces kunmingensis]|uniref:Acyl-CoA dehydrogenase n=1 Tax=Streptomyces kunmingensis TaxID=68225 RepID=A0ABU6CA45_9ACTN|nr:acyl-CoA dehydrogenase [Streptomyces kunmingensis]MEB3961585.1 acyl-CoA dehydrogenase [Streptomyces kunmingensis]